MRAGISLVEILVALTVFSIAGLGSAAAIAWAAREQARAAWRREAISAVRWQIASLGAAPCDSLSSGARSVRGVFVAWTVERDSVIRVRVAASHRGTSARVAFEAACE
jgi:Tfp pilus assembly protein PilV